MDKYEVVNFLKNCTDEDFAEVFVRYHYTCKGYAEDRDLSADDMRIDVDALMKDIRTAVDEIIYSDEIDASAWWKGETA